MAEHWSYYQCANPQCGNEFEAKRTPKACVVCGASVTKRAEERITLCLQCYGRGGTIERQDPVGDGVGFETFLNACPGCLAQHKCPECGGAVDNEYYCNTEDCSWNPESLYD